MADDDVRKFDPDRTVLARGLRFYLVAGLLWYFGEPIRAFIERYCKSALQ